MDTRVVIDHTGTIGGRGAALPSDEAARVPGDSRATVRRRLRSEALAGPRVSGPHGTMRYVDVPAHPRGPGPPREGPRAVAPGAELLAAQAAHLTDLRRQLEARTREVQELHVTIDRLLRALPAPASTAGAARDQTAEAPAAAAGSHRGNAPPPTEEARRPWWRRWLPGG